MLSRQILFLGLILLSSQPTLFSQQTVDAIFDNCAVRQGIPTGNNYHLLMEKGVQGFRKGQYRLAADFFAQAALVSPRHPKAIFYLSCSLFAADAYIPAGQIMRRLGAIFDDWTTLPLHFPSFFAGEQKFSTRLARFEKWLLQEPRSLDSHFLHGILCQFSGETTKAELTYRMILKREPLYVEVYPLLAMLLGAEVSSAYPTLAELQHTGVACLREGKFVQAVQVWSSAAVYYPRQQESLYFLSYSLIAAGDYSQAVTALRLAIAQAASLFSKQINKGALGGDRMQWLPQLEEKLRQDTSRSEILLLLGYCYSIIGETRKARMAFEHLQAHKYYANTAQIMLAALPTNNR